MLEKGQLLERILNETHVLVFVIKDSLLEVLADERVLNTNLLKVFFAQFSNSAILASNDGCCSQTFVDKRNFSENLTLTQYFIRLVILLFYFLFGINATINFCLSE